MVTVMGQVDGENDPLNRVTLNDISFVKLEKKSVADFATKTTQAFSTKLSFHHHSGKRIMIIGLPQMSIALLTN